jgi:ABC exporter DevB family membrane fusion protein
LGRLDPADGVISISAVPGERLLELNPDVREGGEVEPGARLGKLASYELRARQVAALNVRVDLAEKEREHELRVAAAQRNQALAAAAQAEAKLAELQAQRATLEALAEAAAIAREDLARLRLLGQSDPELVSSHELRRQENATARAESESMAAATAHPLAVTAAQRALEAAQANVTLAEQAYAQAQAVNPTLAIAAERDVADEALRQSELFAPGTAGDDAVFRVLKVLMQPGEFVTQLPIVQIADVRRMACVAEVFEADVAELTVGQAAIVRSKALSPPYREQGLRGTVRSIGTLVSNPDLENRNPLAPVDRSVVEVVIDLDPQDAAATAEAASKLGLQVTVEFLTTGDATPAAGAATAQP